MPNGMGEATELLRAAVIPLATETKAQAIAGKITLHLFSPDEPIDVLGVGTPN